MKNTQTYNTGHGIKKLNKDLKCFLKNYNQKNKTNKVKKAMKNYYNAIYQDSLLFPPCNIVNSLRNDITQIKINNIASDVKVIDSYKDKMKY